ncbi:hypothetical protein LBMAG49_00080 [Planctomycetota bacterium]|nr:hypothetical protein LBMAG49_00080 [Planctomycetota bacterium]
MQLQQLHRHHAILLHGKAEPRVVDDFDTKGPDHARKRRGKHAPDLQHSTVAIIYTKKIRTTLRRSTGRDLSKLADQ